MKTERKEGEREGEREGLLIAHDIAVSYAAQLGSVQQPVSGKRGRKAQSQVKSLALRHT